MMPNMKKRGGRERGGNYYNKGNPINEHDDRISTQEVTRRVSFKSHGNGRRNRQNRQRGWDNKVRNHLNDDDIEMVTIRNNQHYQSKKNRAAGSGGGGNFHRDGGPRRMLIESSSHWYKVIIRHGHKYDKDCILKLLQGYIKPLPLITYAYKIAKDESTFIIDEYATAVELLQANRRITVSDGFKLVIHVRPLTPFVEVDEKLTEVIKRAMAIRYNGYTKSLSLSKFHTDQLLTGEGMFCPLNRPNVMIAVLAIIGESIPDLIALDLSHNKINATEHMKILVEKVPNLKILHIGANKLRDIKQLDPLKGLPLDELILDGNTLCDKFTDREVYIRAVRQRFPKVLKLDGVELPPPILFDVEDEGKLPASQASFMCEAAGSAVVRQFLEQYYQLYDSESRMPLVQAYHENAQFSMDVHNPPGENNNLSSYLPESRNLLRVASADRRVRLLRRDRENIVHYLASLPRTEHDPTSFTVDLVLFTPQLMEVCVGGVFREPAAKKPLMRFFSRVFIIIPMGSGYCIINEQMTIMPASPEQIKKSFKTMVAPEVSVVAPLVGNPMEADLLAKQQMVNTLAVKTGMNLPWSEKCLVETNWNFDQALFAFTELQKQGTIPADAFIK